MTILSRVEIESRIPHRDPFLWLDEVVSLESERIVARTRIDAAHPVLAGHFPGEPIVPGVVQMEACFQAGAILLSEWNEVEESGMPVVTKAENARFRRMIRPGEVMEIEVSLSDRAGKAFAFVGRVTVDGTVASRVEFVCTRT